NNFSAREYTPVGQTEDGCAAAEGRDHRCRRCRIVWLAGILGRFLSSPIDVMVDEPGISQVLFSCRNSKYRAGIAYSRKACGNGEPIKREHNSMPLRRIVRITVLYVGLLTPTVALAAAYGPDYGDAVDACRANIGSISSTYGKPMDAPDF